MVKQYQAQITTLTENLVEEILWNQRFNEFKKNELVEEKF
jgi:hypothetical protein